MEWIRRFRSRSAYAAPLVLALALAAPDARAQLALGTAFTYQGSLSDGGVAANGDYDMIFALYDDASVGSQLGTATADDQTVVRGVFTVALDFGAQFDGNRRWLELSVRPGASTGAYTVLAPRVELTAAPHAIYAIGAGDADLLDGMDSTEFALPSDVDWNSLANIPPGFADDTDDADDADADPTNELNTGLALSGTELQVGDAGGTLTLDLAPLQARTLDEVLTTGMDAGGLDAVNFGAIGIGTATPTDELTMEAGTFLQTSGDPIHAGVLGDDATTELDAAWGVAVAGRYAYVSGSNDDGVQIVDVSDPANPFALGSITDDATTELDVVRGIDVAGRYAYAAAFADDGFQILDVSDPANPAALGSIADDATTELDGAASVAVVGRYAYVAATTDDGVAIIDVADPNNPVQVGSITDDATTELDGARSIAVAGRYAYVASDADAGVEILDVSDPTNPIHVGGITDGGPTELSGAFAIAVAGRYAYVASSTDSGFQILDVSDPANPSHVGSIGDDGTTRLFSAVGVAIAGRYAYVTSTTVDPGVEVLDISDPTNPVHAGSIADSGTTRLNGATGIAIEGRYAYVASQFDDGLEILELPGIDVPGGNIGSVFTDSLAVAQGATIGHDLHIQGGLGVGNGAYVQGGFAVSGDASLLGAVSAPNLATGTGTTLVLDANGDVVQAASSARFKANVRPANLDPAKVLALEAKRYEYKDSGETSLGYVAEQLDALGLNDLVNYDRDGKPYSIAYDRIPLYQNELLKRHEAELEAKDAEIAELRERLTRLERALSRP